MDKWNGFFGIVVKASCSLLFIVLMYILLSDQELVSVQNSKSVLDYSNVVVILLATVTVVISALAIGLAVLGILGYKEVKAKAATAATDAVKEYLEEAFTKTGQATELIRSGLNKEDDFFKKEVDKRIRLEVIALLPLVMQGLSNADGKSSINGSGFDVNSPSDEGDLN